MLKTKQCPKTFRFYTISKSKCDVFGNEKERFHPLKGQRENSISSLKFLRNTTTISRTCLNISNSVNNTVANKTGLKLIPKAFPLFNRKLNGE